MKKSLISLFILLGSVSFWGSVSIAKEDAKRTPSSVDAVVTVDAPNLKEALRKMARDSKVAAIINSVRAEYKDCGGALYRFDDKAAMQTYSGKGSASTHFNSFLVPITGGCGGTGMIEEAALVGKIGVSIDLEKDTETYRFYGFVKVKTVPITEKDQHSGLSDF